MGDTSLRFSRTSLSEAISGEPLLEEDDDFTEENMLPLTFNPDRKCPPVDGKHSVYFRDPADCSAFYQCSIGKAYHMRCPTGLYFNEKYNVCDFPANVKCHHRTLG